MVAMLDTPALTAAESRVLELKLDGLPDAMIATVLGLSLGATQQHIFRIRAKLGASEYDRSIWIRLSAERERGRKGA